jgi:hypothetical protein
MKKLAIGLIVALPIALLGWACFLVLFAPPEPPLRLDEQYVRRRSQCSHSPYRPPVHRRRLRRHLGHPTGLPGLARPALASAKAYCRPHGQSLQIIILHQRIIFIACWAGNEIKLVRSANKGRNGTSTPALQQGIPPISCKTHSIPPDRDARNTCSRPMHRLYLSFSQFCR